jgi:uroporphyrinogen decarboxylase
MRDLTARERFQAVMHFQPGVRWLLWEWGYWNGTVERWYGEGLKRTPDSLPPGFPPGGICSGEAHPWPDRAATSRYRDVDVHIRLGFDDGSARIPVNWRHCPRFAETILDENEHTRLMINEDGVKVRVRKGRDSLPQHLEWPVRDRRSWEKVKEERLGLHTKARLPETWDALALTYRDRNYPLGVIIDGFFNIPRELLGLTRQLMMYYDDPALMHDITSHLSTVFLATLEEIVSRVELGFVCFWEDLVFKNGPLISPSLFGEFLVPTYRRVTEFLRARGIDVICVDTDGDFSLLIPLFQEGGVNGFYPFEVRAGMEVVQVRKAFPSLMIQGGVDKTRIASGKPAIDAELEAKLPFVLAHGGYIPFCDHMVPPDVSWDNFVYYRKKVREYVERYAP